MLSPIPWMGGKRRLADQILPLIPAHTAYVEPFAGGASILFMRDEPSRVEVLNDLDGDLVNFFRVVKHHMLEFCQQFRWSIVSRQMFAWLNDTPPETLTDIQRAARFFYLQKLCFGGKSTGRTFGTSATTGPRLNLVRLEEDMSALHERLAHVVIENLDWKNCVTRYDRIETFFFVDPPYWKTAGYAGARLAIEDYESLASWMQKAQGKVMLTINDHPDMRRVFTDFRAKRVELSYTVGGANGREKKNGEMIYRNW